MEYQTDNNDNLESNALYQAAPSIENKFLDEVLGSNISMLRETIEQLEKQIEKRKKIRLSNIEKIMTDECAANSELKNLPPWLFPAFDKKRLTLEQQMLRLKKEERDEDTTLWKDIQILNKDLAEAKKEYQAMKSKVQSLMPDKLYSTFGFTKKEKTEPEKTKDDSEDNQIDFLPVRLP